MWCERLHTVDSATARHCGKRKIREMGKICGWWGENSVYAVMVGTCHLSIPIEPAIPAETLNANCGVWGTVIYMGGGRGHTCAVPVISDHLAEP